MGLALETVPYYSNSGGLDLRSSPTKTPEDKSTHSLNVDYTTDGSVRSRYGSSQLNPGPDRQVYLGRFNAQAAFPFIKSDGTQREISVWGGYIYVSLENPGVEEPPILTEDESLELDIEYIATQNDEYAILGNGIDPNLKYDGTTWTELSIVAPAAAPVAALGGAGLLNLVAPAYYDYYYTFANYDALNGVIIQESPLSPISNQLTPALQSIDLTIAVSADPQVNARIIYRRDPLFAIYYQHAIIANNVAVVYNDNVVENGSIIEADFDNANLPLTNVFEEYGGRIFYKDAEKGTDLCWTLPNEPWNAPIENRYILDGNIRAMHRFFGTLIIGTDRSMWVFSGDPDALTGSILKRISSKIGVFNNRCIAGESILYFLATNRRFYKLSPTDLSENEIRIDFPLSDDVYPRLETISLAQLDKTAIEYYTTANVAKVYITYNVGAGTNQNILIYNETQSILKGFPVWQPWDHIQAVVIKQFNTDNQFRLVALDNNGFFWKLEDSAIDGDGAEINGTATSGGNLTLTQSNLVDVDSIATAGGANTLTDGTQAWTVNEWQAVQIYIYQGTGNGQTRIVQSNTPTVITVTVAWGTIPDATSRYYIGGLIVDQHVGQMISIIGGTGEGQTRVIDFNNPIRVTVLEAWDVNPDATSEYTIGGFETFHFSNWKYVLENYDVLKQLWFIWLNANASGDYNITLIIQIDFDTTTSNQTELLVNLSARNAIWSDGNDPSDDPDILWGDFIWGSRSVFQDRFRNFQRFRAMRIGFRHLPAGQPWQVNGFSLSCQNKKLFFSGAP